MSPLPVKAPQRGEEPGNLGAADTGESQLQHMRMGGAGSEARARELSIRRGEEEEYCSDLCTSIPSRNWGLSVPVRLEHCYPASQLFQPVSSRQILINVYCIPGIVLDVRNIPG